MNEEEKFYRLTKDNEYTHTVKGSKFIAYAKRVSSVEDAEDYLAQLKKSHFKARHHCYAYRLGEKGEYYRANDDGEPSGTAGLPIYNQIQSFELSEVMVVVVRYFGGTLLGVSGLIKAYKEATQGVLEATPRKLIVPMQLLNVRVDYPSVNALMQVIERHEITIISQEMAMRCTYQLQCVQTEIDAIRQALLAVTGLEIIH